MNNLNKLIVILLTVVFLSACGKHKFIELNIFSRLHERDIKDMSEFADKMRDEQNNKQWAMFPSTGQRLV
jgi:hypothetical protein